LFSEKVERFLDAGHGKCVLQDGRVASVVRDALAHFDGQRYDVLVWCVMPNHVHVIVRPRPGHQLSDILHSWKSFTATQINRLLGQTGMLWQPESFDHLIRDAEDGERSVAYVLANPESVGLKDWKWCGMGFQPMSVQAQDEPATKHGQDARATDNDIRKGFVYKRVPHVTLKSIANNPDIKEGMTREQIDAAIARHAEQETLFDQPYEDNRRIRVTGPFTVESLSPHRVLETDQGSGTGFQPVKHRQDAGATQQDFATMIIENLRKAGVQNTKKNERLKFDRLDPFAGTWIHAAGDFTECGTGVPPVVRRVAVSIGPEHGTVGPLQVKEAAKEAVQGIGFHVLIVCGFAFDPHVAEEAKRYGKLTVLPARMNPDLAMGDELLKKTGAGNLFMVFGEPDLDIRRVKSEPGARATGPTEQIVVEIKGVDVYDPTTGQIRSDSTDDIACWFIDTEYNGESFFVRHAYFTGAAKDGEGPYDKLKRALRAEIDEAAWSTLYSTTSRPFAPPPPAKSP
jgi:adenine-specific DNA-methyltransferase